MDKNTVIAIVLSTLVIIGGFTIQAKFFPPDQVSTNLPATEKTVSSSNQEIIAPSSFIENTIEILPDTETQLSEEHITIETELVKIVFTNRGGDILSYQLKKHSDKDTYVEMANFTTDSNRAFSIILGNSSGKPLNDLFSVKRIDENSIGFFRNYDVKNEDGSISTFTLAKQYSFLPNDYMFDLKITINGDSTFSGLNSDNASYTLITSPQIGPEWKQKQDKYEYRRFYHLLEGKKKTVNVGQGQTKAINDHISWTGVAGKYFTLIAIPQEIPVSTLLYSTRPTIQDETAAQIYLTRAPILGNKSTDVWRFYIGPRTDKNLSKYNIITNNPYGMSNIRLDQIVEGSGILGPLEVVLKWMMEFFYKIIPNWGVSIIILTVLMRLILFPLTKKSSESTHKMQELQPKIKEIQDKYQGNQQKMNEEMAKFYKTVGYNPLSGCLPMLIQFPLIFAMYGLFNNYFEFRGAMFIPGWIPDLSQGDSIMNLPFTVPFLGWSNIRLLPMIYVVSQLLFSKVTQTPAAGQQNSSMKMMMYGMPLFFFFIFYNAPAGLLVYWIFSNVLTLIQQVIINKMMAKNKDTNLRLVKK
ncbi:MAG TPA: membrane protein insertase YidC [Treponemataceae bacterium]|nr:membrane protein insertase YidC [Treponemataceae bacterium]